MDNVRLVMWHGKKLKLLSHNSYSYSFLDWCEDVEVAIEKLKIKYPIFIIEYEDHNLVLGQLFLNLIKFNQKYKLDRIFSIITHLQTQQATVFQTLVPQNSLN